MSETALAKLDRAESAFDAWSADGRKLANGQSTSRQFEIGDWLVRGEDIWGIRRAYREARHLFPNTAHSTLKTFASVARSVQPLTRVNDLTFGHHRLVARFDPELQRKLLKDAATAKVSVGAFRKSLEAEYPTAKPEAPAIPTPPPERLTREDKRALRTAAKALKLAPEALLAQIVRNWLVAKPNLEKVEAEQIKQEIEKVEAEQIKRELARRRPNRPKRGKGQRKPSHWDLAVANGDSFAYLLPDTLDTPAGRKKFDKHFYSSPSEVYYGRPPLHHPRGDFFRIDGVRMIGWYGGPKGEEWMRELLLETKNEARATSENDGGEVVAVVAKEEQT